MGFCPFWVLCVVIRGLWVGLITCPEKSYRVQRVVNPRLWVRPGPLVKTAKTNICNVTLVPKVLNQFPIIISKFYLLSTYNSFPYKLPRGLRRRSAATSLLRSWVRILPVHGSLSVVSVVCCQLEVSATSWSLVQRSPTVCGASLCVI
jgi:hypothetical protein